MERPDPQQVLLQRPDEALSDAIALGLRPRILQGRFYETSRPCRALVRLPLTATLAYISHCLYIRSYR